jgi:hypothetical protein
MALQRSRQPNKTLLGLPLQIIGTVGWPNHKLDMGAGGCLIMRIGNSQTEAVLKPTFSLGYRFLSKNGYLFRACFTPLIDTENDNLFLPFIGFSFGYSFGKNIN